MALSFIPFAFPGAPGVRCAFQTRDSCKYAFQKAIFPHNWSKKVLIQSILDKDDINRGTTLFR